MFIRILLLSFSLLLIILSYPGGPFPLLVIVAMAPALIATSSLSPVRSALALGLWAWLWWLAALWWGVPSLMNFSQSSAVVSALIIGAICFNLALPYAISGFVIAYFKLWQTPLSYLSIPLCFAVFISVFATVLPAAPVNALFEYPMLLQWADIGGLPLLVFFYFMFNTGVAGFFLHSDQKPLMPLLVCSGVVMGILSYGYFRMAEDPPFKTVTVSVGYIQPSLTPQDHLSDLIAQTTALKSAVKSLELIIWPEVPVDFSWHNKQYERYRIKNLAKELDVSLLILPGYHYVNNENADGGHFNSANLISSAGENLAEYNKQKLVPFFEYLPFKQLLSSYFPNTRNYIAGKQAVAFPFNAQLLAPLICYEALFSNMVRPYVDQGVSVIINPGNDGWFGEVGALSHLSLSLLRSIEYRLPLVRVNNSGVSTVINNKGEIEFDTLSPLGAIVGRGFLLELPSNPQTAPQTFYYRHGNILFGLAIVGLIVLLIYRKKQLSLAARRVLL